MAEPSRSVNYLNVEHGVRSWLLTVDHKRIALLYLVSITIFFGPSSRIACEELLTRLRTTCWI